MTDFTKRARQLRDLGYSQKDICRLMDASLHHVRCAVDDGYLARTVKTKGTAVDFMGKEARADGERLLAEIPPDTRGLTARLCGDPLPGRRAIDLKHKGQ